jgi:hypothetical protein
MRLDAMTIRLPLAIGNFNVDNFFRIAYENA